MVKSDLLGKAAHGVLACALAGSVFWWVAENSGPCESTVVVHVLEPGVEVSLAGQLYHFREPTSEPLVLHLPAGSHHFLVRRGETILHVERFTLRGGESRVLVAISDERGRLVPACSWLRIGLSPRRPGG
jgi:hypothetical protein